MEAALKALNIAAKVLACRSNVGYPATTEEAAKALAGNALTTKSIRLQTEYMGTRKTRITLHGVPMYITEDHLGTYFSSYGLVDGVSAAKGKSGLTTSDINQKKFE